MERTPAWAHGLPRHAHPAAPAVKRAGWITKLQLFHDGKCVVGIEPTYAYSSTGAQLLGRTAKASKALQIYPASGEFFTKVEAGLGRCAGGSCVGCE